MKTYEEQFDEFCTSCKWCKYFNGELCENEEAFSLKNNEGEGVYISDPSKFSCKLFC